jgi:hypothetical protein
MRDEAIETLTLMKSLVPYMTPEEVKEFERIEMKAVNATEKKEDLDNLMVILRLIMERINKK